MVDFIIDFQNSIFYEFIRNFMACIFYILLAIYVFYKLYNIFLIKKSNCKDKYTEKKKQILSDGT